MFVIAVDGKLHSNVCYSSWQDADTVRHTLLKPAQTDRDHVHYMSERYGRIYHPGTYVVPDVEIIELEIC